MAKYTLFISKTAQKQLDKLTDYKGVISKRKSQVNEAIQQNKVLKVSSEFFWQRFKDKAIRIVNPRIKNCIWYRIIHQHGIPMVLIHVIARYNGRVIFPENNSLFRITFKIYAAKQLYIGQCKNFSMNLVDKRVCTKGKLFSYALLLKTIISEYFYVHYR